MYLEQPLKSSDELHVATYVVPVKFRRCCFFTWRSGVHVRQVETHLDGTISQWQTPLTVKTVKMSGKLKVVDGSMVSVCDTYYKLLERSTYS